MFSKRLFFASGAILLLTVAYHMGASTAVAQAPSNSVVGITYGSSAVFVATAGGDVYVWGGPATGWTRYGSNVFTGAGPTNERTESFGALKAKYR